MLSRTTAEYLLHSSTWSTVASCCVVDTVVDVFTSPVCTKPAGMQRRTVGKTQAHISPPNGSSSTMGGQDSEKSRLSRRNFGVTNRIWIILSLILSIFLLSRYILSSSSSSSASGHRLLSSDLKPKNYLNATELQQRGSPFAFCPVYGEGDEVGKKYSALALTKTRLHLGSGARIQRVVNKALNGLPVTVSVIGGSGMLMFRFPLISSPQISSWLFSYRARHATRLRLDFQRTLNIFLEPN